MNKPKKSTRVWIARDSNDLLFLYNAKPFKHLREWRYSVNNYTCGVLPIDKELFPFVKWEDEEPTEVIVRIK